MDVSGGNPSITASIISPGLVKHDWQTIGPLAGAEDGHPHQQLHPGLLVALGRRLQWAVLVPNTWRELQPTPDYPSHPPAKTMPAMGIT